MAGQWWPYGSDVLVGLDAGYDVPRIAHLLVTYPWTYWVGSTRTG
ncbi:hypothetical protein ACIRSJ_36980 [Streptomyces virginiae]